MSDPVRPRRSGDLVAAVARRTTPRDRGLCHVLWDHRVLTTAQVADLAFDSLRSAQRRLAALHRLRVVERFRPFRPTGSDPYHYTLGELGAALVAADRGIEAPTRASLRTRALALADSQRLRHLLGTNGLFCALAREARSEPGAELERWWSEQRCAAEWGGVVRPDGFGVWRQGPSQVAFFVEQDEGTETLARLAAKLDGYRDLAEATGWRPWVLFWFPTAGREAQARRGLGRPGIPVATASAALGRPGEAVWLPLGEATGRRSLGRLTAPPGSIPYETTRTGAPTVCMPGPGSITRARCLMERLMDAGGSPDGR